MSAWMVTVAVDGTTNAVEMPADPDAHLKALQEAVGGYIERVSVFWYPDLAMYINEEGRIHKLPINLTATRLYGMGPILGPAVIVGSDDRPLRETAARKILREIAGMTAVSS